MALPPLDMAGCTTWTCPACTLVNERAATMCDACGYCFAVSDEEELANRQVINARLQEDEDAAGRCKAAAAAQAESDAALAASMRTDEASSSQMGDAAFARSLHSVAARSRLRPTASRQQRDVQGAGTIVRPAMPPSPLLLLASQDGALLALVLHHTSLQDVAAFARAAVLHLPATIAFLRDLVQRLRLSGLPRVAACLGVLRIPRLHEAITHPGAAPLRTRHCRAGFFSSFISTV